MENLNENINRLRQIMSYDRSRSLLISESQYSIEDSIELEEHSQPDGWGSSEEESIEYLENLADFALTRYEDEDLGGGLFWNDNIVPEIGDESSEDKYVNDYYMDMWYKNDDVSDEMEMSDRIPHLIKGYRETLRKHYDGEINLNDANRFEDEDSSLRTDSKTAHHNSGGKTDVKKMIMTNALHFRNEIEDPFDFADNVIASTTEELENESYRGLDYDEIYDMLRNEYTEFILNLK